MTKKSGPTWLDMQARRRFAARENASTFTECAVCLVLIAGIGIGALGSLTKSTKRSFECTEYTLVYANYGGGSNTTTQESPTFMNPEELRLYEMCPHVHQPNFGPTSVPLED